MGEAIDLAREMQGRVWPNPPVGCVIVRDAEVVGRGQTQFGGRPHAERVALDDAGPLARGATLYVTLEPCCHWGKTPPCADAIIAAGIATVYASIQDPDPRVNGGGFRKLREAGIKVEVGLGREAAHGVMEGFFTRIALGRPLITVSIFDADAQSHNFAPDAFDAVLTSAAPSRLAVTIRNADGGTETIRLGGRAMLQELAHELGRLGLTSILIPANDPLAESWRAAGLVDHVMINQRSFLPSAAIAPVSPARMMELSRRSSSRLWFLL